MFSCPHCQEELQLQRGAQGVIYACPSCRGGAASLSVLRKVFGPERVAILWADLNGPQGCACPVCRQAMRRVTWVEDDQPITLDLCRRCEFVWFDPQEYESIAPAPPKPRPLGDIDRSALSPEAREKLAMIDVERLTRERELTDGPHENWQTMAGYLGLPVEIDAEPEVRMPVATYGMTAAIAAVALFEFFVIYKTGNSDIIKKFGLIPAEWRRDYGITFLTSFFLHGSVLHLVGNLYFLVVFGRQVENYLGAVRWLVLLAAAAIVGDVVDILLTSDSVIPTIGASGGVSGLLAFYALKFPRARLAIAFRYFFVLRWMTISAWSAFGIWVLLQLVGGYEQVKHVGSVAALAHLGGVSAGVGAYCIWRNLDTKPGRAADGPQVTVA